MKKMEQNITKRRKEKNPLEEVKNLLEPLSRTTQVTPAQTRRRKNEIQIQPTPRPNPVHHQNNTTNTTLERPIMRPSYTDFMPSAMKGVILTSTGEALATPSPAEIVNLFNRSPKIGLNFGKIFDFEEGNSVLEKPTGKHQQQQEEEELESPPPSPSTRKEKEKEKDAPPPTRIRKPSIRTGSRPLVVRSSTVPNSNSSSVETSTDTCTCFVVVVTQPTQTSATPSPPTIDEQYKSSCCCCFRLCFCLRVLVDFCSMSSSTSSGPNNTGSRIKRRGSSGLLLRAVATVNNAGRRTLPSPELDASASASTFPSIPSSGDTNDFGRPSGASARKALHRS